MTPGAHAARRLATVATGAAAALVPLLYVPQLAAAFLVPKTAALELAAALALVAFALRPGAIWSRRLAWAAVAVLATTAASWAMAAHAPYAPSAVARWAALFGLACGASLLDDDGRQSVLEAAAAGAAVVSALGVWQHLELTRLPIPVISTPGSTFGNRNLAAEAIALALPFTFGAAVGARGRPTRIALVATLGLELVYLAATRTRGAWLGAAAGMLTVIALSRARWPRAAVGFAVGAVALAGVAALVPGQKNPLYVGDSKRLASAVEVAEQSLDPRSVALRTRLGLWRRTLRMIGDHPILGVGPGSWPIQFPRYAEPDASRDGVLSASLAPRQAHDDLLERTAETGLVGLAALAALGAAVFVSVRRSLRAADERARPSTAAAAGALVALAGVGVTGFPLEMPATLALGGVALGLVARQGGDAPPRSQWRRRVEVALAVALLAWAGSRAARHVRGSAWLTVAERALHADRGVDGAMRALPALDRARAATPDELLVHLRTAQMLLRLHRAPEAAEAARRALALEPDSPNCLATLAAAQLGAGDLPGARESASRALALLHDHPFALLVSAQIAEAAGDAPSAADGWARLHALAASSVVDRPTAAAARELLDQFGRFAR
jgi:O-antigen ligase